MLNVFFVRPSDNGYYGVAEALLGQPRNDVRVRTSLFRSTQFPLTYPLPKRLDGDMQGWYGLQAYDLIVLAGIDPEVLSPKEMRNIVAYVEHGGGLFLMGGVVSGSRRVGTYEPLRPVLPVEFLPEDDVTLNVRSRYMSAHPVTRGLPPIQGRVQTVHTVRPRADAKVLMEAGCHPLLVALERGRGRVLFLNTYPQCGTTTEDCFFTDRFYGDVLRQATQWLTSASAEQETHSDLETGFTSLDVPTTTSPGGTLQVSSHITVTTPTTLSATLRAGQTVLSSALKKMSQDGTARLALDVPPAPDLPKTLHVALEARNTSDRLLAYRCFTVEAKSVVDLDLTLRGGAEALAPGMPLIVHVTLRDRRRSRGPLAFSAQVVDPHGDVLHTWTQLPSKAQPLQWTLGDLCSGGYTIRASVSEAETGQCLRTCTQSFDIVDPQDDEHYFPLVTEALPGGGTVCTNEADLRAMIDDVAEHGFNAVCLGGMGYTDPLTNAERVRRHGERYAQAQGLRLVVAFGSLVPSFSRSEPPDVCVFDPTFDRAVEERVGPQFEEGRLIPRLFMAEILDEPLIASPMICRCGLCLTEFQKRYGYTMPTWEETCEPGREAQRTDLLKFVSDYWAEVFKRCYAFKQKSGVKFDVHHTFCQLTFGTFCSRYYWRDGFAWMPYCDRFDWDTYPYIYPIWRGHLDLRCPNLRYHFAGHRSLSRYFDKPMGHWLDLSDRNVPHWNPPVRASSELLYTAIGQDAKLIRTFFNITFGRNNGVRRERWDDLGSELRKISRFAAVLTQVHKPYARLAMLFPATDWALWHHTGPEDLPAGTPHTDFPLKWDDAPFDDVFPFAGTPYNAFELLLRAFGEADLLPEQMVVLGELKRHRALAIWNARYLRREAAENIARFVLEGGLLLCDGIPEKDERGEPLDGFHDLFSDDFQPICDEVAVAHRKVGRGETQRFNADINAVYTDAVLTDDHPMRRALRRTVFEFLRSHGVVPRARPTNPEFEVNVLSGGDCFLLVVVNHNERDDGTGVELFDPPSDLGYIVDLGSGDEVEIEQEGDPPKLRIKLGERRGAILAVYPERPVRNAVKLPARSFQRGGVFSYEVTVLNEAGRPAKGHHPVELIVRDSAGNVRTRYGGQRATTAGSYRRRVKLAMNERPGRWEVAARDPITRTVSCAQFKVL